MGFQVQQYNLALPRGLTCKNCVLRMERQALQWGAKYRFQSCADVDIVAVKVRIFFPGGGIFFSKF